MNEELQNICNWLKANKLLLNVSLVHSHLNYMILIWGDNNQEILKKQKQAMRILHSEHYLCHSDPLFKKSKILKVSDMQVSNN